MIREFKPSDFVTVIEIWEQLGMTGRGRADNMEVIQRTIAHGAQLFVMEDVENNKIIGTSWITTDWRRNYIHHFAIKPEYQNRGFATVLLQHNLEYVRSTGLQTKLEVHSSNPVAINLYKKHGFKYLGDYLVFIIRDYNELQSHLDQSH